MNHYLFAALLMAIASNSIAASPTEQNLTELYFSGKNLKLTQQERDTLSTSAKWLAASPTGIQPTVASDGAIRYAFGNQLPSVVCAVLQVCDVELQSGEQVNSIHLGDTARWLVEPAITGNGTTEIQHLIIKPMDIGLETSLIVTTNRRTYHLRLRSHRTEFMSRVTFTYPEDVAAKWQAINIRETKEKQDRTLPQTGEYLGDLNFNYQITGSASWKPIRVYNNGSKTIIQMPSTLEQTEAPTLLVVRKDGGWFSDDETVMVNYRLQDDRYIIDTVFEKALLIAGVGSNQDRVTIIKGK